MGIQHRQLWYNHQLSRFSMDGEGAHMRSLDKARFRGCLIGQCLGDALGCLRKGWPREDCESYVAGPLQSWFEGELDEDAYSGQYTDDSLLARELLQSHVDRRRFDPEDYAIFVEDRIVGRGMTTHHAAMRVNDFGTWGYDELVTLSDACFELATGN